MKLLAFILILVLTIMVSCNKYTKEGCAKDANGNEQCMKNDEYLENDEDDEEEPVFYEIEDKLKERKTLFQWDPVKVGYEREIEVAEGQKVTMRTAALRPKAFVIDDFLTAEECDHIVDKAKHFGLASSGLHIDESVAKHKKYTYGQAKSTFGDFGQWDKNWDKEITVDEIILLAKKNLKLYINETDVEEMFKVLNLKELDDGKITREEFNTLNTAGLTEYMKTLREEHPRFRDRYSEQIWLKQGESSDRIMKGLREKVKKITNLPSYIVEGGEPLQVLHYHPHGHYHAHFDGQDEKEFPNYKCCHLDLETQPYGCRLCRFITIIYYLNDVEEGGETAFPVADDADYNHDEFRKRKVEDLYNLSKFCHKAKLVVKPKKGRAVMWYNHFMDKDGWLGDMDYFALHGGCDILKGEKWMANNWLTAPPAKAAHMDSLYLHLDSLGGAF